MSELKAAAAKWSARTIGDGAAGQEDRMRPLTPAEREWKESIYERLLKVLDLSLLATVEDTDARRQIREVCENLITDERAPLSVASRQTIIRRIEDEVLGLGPLEPLLADKTVSDILVNGPQQVYVERRGKLELTDIKFNNDSHLINIIDRIVSAVGRRVDESSPMVDARLKDGSRVNAIIPPLALDGAVLSIRRFAVDR
jgi:pilus assembly protein CpaF